MKTSIYIATICLLLYASFMLLFTNSCTKDENTTCTCMYRNWTSYGGYSSWTSVPNTDCNRYCVPSEVIFSNIVYDNVGNEKFRDEYRWENCGNIINNRPDSPAFISPVDSSNTTTTVTLSWSCNDPDGNSLDYDVYFGQTNPPSYIDRTSNTSFLQEKLKNSTTYYWKIVATDCAGESNSSSIWSFNTGIEIPTVTTAGISHITLNSSVSGGNVTSDGGATVIARGVCWSTGQNPTIDDNKTTDGSGVGSFTSSIAGLSANTTYYVRAYAKNSIGTGYGSTIPFIAFVGTVTDIDGNVYKTIAIGTQIWMTENLRVTKYSNGDEIPNVTDNSVWKALTTGAYCNYGNTNNLDTIAAFGRLYNWYAVSDSRSTAPTGWHAATDADWTTLTTYLGGESVAGGKMKESGTTRWRKPNTGATNECDFTALPSGLRTEDKGEFYNLGYTCNWWSSDQDDLSNVWDRMLDYGNDDCTRSGRNRRSGYSVRCVKD